MEKELTREESLFLNLYERFYGIAYNIDDSEPIVDGEIRATHLRGQKLVYPVSQFINGMFDYYFSWDKKGPHSEELKQFMKNLDANQSLKNNTANIDISRDISQYYQDKIDEFVTSFSDFVNKTRNVCLTDEVVNHNAEIIASLLYISKSLYSVGRFEEVNAELLSRKEWAKDTDNNRNIWNVLVKLNLVPSY